MRNRARAASFFGFVWALTLSHAGWPPARAQNPAGPSPLPMGRRVERAIGGGESHYYRVDLRRGEILRVLVEQKGVNVAARLYGPDGKPLREADNFKGPSEKELLYDLTAADGAYYLAVVATATTRGAYAISYTNSIENLGEKQQITSALLVAGNERFKGNDYAGALLFFEKAAAYAKELSAPSVEAYALSNAGLAHRLSRQYDKALAASTRALNIYRELKDGSAEAVEHVNVAWSYWSLERPEKAVEHTQQALGTLRETKKTNLECIATLVLGNNRMLLNRHEESFQDFERALRLSRELKDRSLEVWALRSVAAASAEVGRYDKALQNLDEALKLLPELADEKMRLAERALIYAGFSYCYIELGQYDKGFDYSEQGLKTARAMKDDFVEQNMLTALGVAYLRLGSLQKAEGYLTEAADLGRRLNNRQAAALGVANLGAVYSRLKRYDRAVGLFEESLPALRELRMTRLVVIFSYYYGMVRREQGELDKAVALHKEAVELARATQTPKYEARALCELGLDYLAQRSGGLAMAQFTAALSLARQVNARDEEAAALDGLMRAWEAAGARRPAIFIGKQAVGLLQSTRQDIVKVDRRMQAEFVKDNEQTYRRLADLLVAEGRISEAEQVLGMLKEEEVFSYLRRDDKVAREMLRSVSLNEKERAAIKRYEALADRVTALGKEFGELDGERKKYGPGQFPGQARFDELKAQLADATVAFQKFLDGLKVEFSGEDRRVAAVDSGLQQALKRMKASHTAIVSTIVGEGRLNIIVTTADAQRAHTVNVTATEVNRLVAEFREALSTPKVDPRPAGQKLYDLLVRPIEGDLAGVEADTIAWSLDGTLRYVPTAALWDARRGYLAERFASVMLTLAGSRTIELPVSDRRAWSALGVGVSKPVEGFSALTAVPDELDCIITDSEVRTVSPRPVCPSGVLAGRKLLNETFTLPAFEDSLGRYPVVHIASHFSLNPGNEKDSFLLLGGGERKRFTVEDLRGLSLADVELVVLSACNTATPGGERANGVEIEGFGAVAQKQGAKAVLATLWSVADDSTRDLMVSFYKLYGKGDLSKAEALRRAQVEMIRAAPRAASGAGRGSELAVGGDGRPAFSKYNGEPYAHPYFWSPFVLIGNWK